MPFKQRGNREINLGLDGKRALVFSSSRGLGLAVAESLAVEQANVVLTARDKMLLETAVAKISAAGRGRAHAVPGDLRHDAEEIWCTAQNLLGGVDILIANTGGPPARSALNVKIEEWEPQFEIMVLPIMQLTAWALPGMRERHFGRIIVIGSTSIVQPIPNLVISTALRSAVAGWSKTLAAEVAKDGITVNMVLPWTNPDRPHRRTGRRERQNNRQVDRGHYRRNVGLNSGRALRAPGGVCGRGVFPRLGARQLRNWEHDQS